MVSSYNEETFGNGFHDRPVEVVSHAHLHDSRVAHPSYNWNRDRLVHRGVPDQRGKFLLIRVHFLVEFSNGILIHFFGDDGLFGL